MDVETDIANGLPTFMTMGLPHGVGRALSTVAPASHGQEAVALRCQSLAACPVECRALGLDRDVLEPGGVTETVGLEGAVPLAADTRSQLAFDKAVVPTGQIELRRPPRPTGPTRSGVDPPHCA